ncbi:MAG: trypsin-like serine protease [Nocardiopsaceae bacterium]|nr:trypsin-like serine protease [Nocardiopsaceae bacterium]
MGTKQRRLTALAGGLVMLAAVAGVTTAGAGPAAAMTNGQPVTRPGTAPWVATLALTNHSAQVPGTAGLPQRATCGGALIAPARVLTAAHCVDGLDPSQAEVHINARVLSHDPGVVRRVAGVSVLPGYRLLPSSADPGNPDSDSARNDLAIIDLDRPVTSIPPISVAPYRPAPGTPVAAFTHGTTGGSGPEFRDDVLHRGDLTAIGQAACQEQTPATVDRASVTCAESGTSGGVVNMCYDDSGSPVVAYRSGEPELVGVNSFGGETAGKPCDATTPQPWAFTNVPAFLGWSYSPFHPREPYPAGRAAIAGSPRADRPLRCQAPAWDQRHGGRPSKVSYGWATVTQTGVFALPTPIAGATAPTFTPTPDLTGKHVTCTVTAANQAGTIQATATPVMISG